MFNERLLIAQTPEKIGEQVLLCGFVERQRDHGKIKFFDLRDRSGKLQIVVLPRNASAQETLKSIKNESVVAVTVKINARPKGIENKEMATGAIEGELLTITVLSHAKDLPFEVSTDTKNVGEELRFKYRYLDLRSERMARNLRLRHTVTMLARQYLTDQGFIEIETPLLTKSSPEGARDFLVPSRLQPGKFYALPQAPQQYKQLLMIAGFERYFQIARALRDEDLRGDRQLEHTQIDLEMSYVNARDVLDVVEGMMIKIAESCGKKVLQKPFPVFTYAEAKKQFGADKFDLRPDPKDPNVMVFAWVVDFPLFEWDEELKRFTFAHNPFSAPKTEDVEKLLAEQDLGSLHAQQYDLVCNGLELASGGVRISDPQIQRKVFEIMGLTKKETEERFGHLISAYEYGAPPHAGMAPGLDRLVMLLAGEENIREVIAFPVNASGMSSVMEAPSPVSKKQLDELNIRVVAKRKK